MASRVSGFRESYRTVASEAGILNVAEKYLGVFLLLCLLFRCNSRECRLSAPASVKRGILCFDYDFYDCHCFWLAIVFTSVGLYFLEELIVVSIVGIPVILMTLTFYGLFFWLSLFIFVGLGAASAINKSNAKTDKEMFFAAIYSIGIVEASLLL